MTEQSQTAESQTPPENTNPESTQPGEGTPDDGWDAVRQDHATRMDRIREWTAETWFKLRAGHEAMMLQDAQSTLREQRRVTENHHNQTLGTPVTSTVSTPGSVTPDGMVGLDEMINLGTINCYRTEQSQKPVTEQAQAAKPVSQTPQKSGLSAIGKLLAGAALLGTGAGAAYGIPLLLDYLQKPAAQTPETPAATEHKDTDTDTQYDFSLHPPK